MRRGEIRETVSKGVREWCDCKQGTLDAVIPLANDTCAVIEKELGGSPSCHVFFNDDDATGRNLPRVCELIEAEALEAVTDIVEQANFKGYVEEEMPNEYMRNLYRQINNGTNGQGDHSLPIAVSRRT